MAEAMVEVMPLYFSQVSVAQGEIFFHEDREVSAEHHHCKRAQETNCSEALELKPLNTLRVVPTPAHA